MISKKTLKILFIVSPLIFTGKLQVTRETMMLIDQIPHQKNTQNVHPLRFSKYSLHSIVIYERPSISEAEKGIREDCNKLTGSLVAV